MNLELQEPNSKPRPIQPETSKKHIPPQNRTITHLTKSHVLTYSRGSKQTESGCHNGNTKDGSHHSSGWTVAMTTINIITAQAPNPSPTPKDKCSPDYNCGVFIADGWGKKSNAILCLFGLQLCCSHSYCADAWMLDSHNIAEQASQTKMISNTS